MSFSIKSCTLSLQLSEGLSKGGAGHCSHGLVTHCSVALFIVHHQPQQQVQPEAEFSLSLSCVILVTSSLRRLGVWERESTKEEKDDSSFIFHRDLGLFKVTGPAESHMMSVLVLLLCLVDTSALHGMQTVDSASVGLLALSPIILPVSLSGPNTLDYQTI